jgi:hypothetical protein
VDLHPRGNNSAKLIKVLGDPFFNLNLCANKEEYEESGTWVLFPAWKIGSPENHFPNKGTFEELLLVP